MMESGDGDRSAMNGGGGGGVDLSESGDAERDGGEKGDEVGDALGVATVGEAPGVGVKQPASLAVGCGWC